MQQPYPPEDIGKPDRCKSKSSLSLLWEELYGPPIDLKEFVESCWNSHNTIDIDLEDPQQAGNDNLSHLSKPLLKDSGTSSLNDEDQNSIIERDGLTSLSRQPVSVKTMVQQFSQSTNGLERGKWHLVVRELIETEKIYLKSLTEVEDGYLAMSNSIFADDQEVMKIFSNWRKLRIFHLRFLNRLKLVKSYEFNGLLKLSQCFIDEVEQFEHLYSKYCTNYSESVKYLHGIETASSDTWKNLIKCQTELGHQLPLSTFLLKPVQRILKYHLLLKELIQSCKLIPHPNNTMVVESLLKALENMVQVANQINARQMEREEQLRRLQLRDELYADILSAMLTCPDLGQPFLDGELKVPGCRNSRLVLLCQNAMVLAKRLSAGRWDIKQVIKCHQMMLFEYIPKQPLEFHVVDISDNKNKATLQATNAEEKEIWCKMIKQLIISTFETDSISERAKRILLDKKSNVLAQCQPMSNEVLDKFHFHLTRVDDLLDLESSLRRILDPVSNTPFIGAKHKNFKRRNSVDAIKSESKINFRDPSIYQWSSRRNYTNDDDADCRSITIDVNEENLGQRNVGSNAAHEQTYERYIERSRTKIRLTPEDIQEIFQPLRQMQDTTDNSNVLMNEMELASLCSDPDLDSVASDSASNTQHKRQSTSMDRTFGISLYVKANSFTNNSDSAHQSSAEFTDNSHRKKPLFSSVRETKSTRSNSDWGSLFDVEAKSGLVKRFFKASVKLTKRDKRKCSTGQIEGIGSIMAATASNNNNNNICNSSNNNHNNSSLQVDPGNMCKPATRTESKRAINKSNSTDYIVQSQNHLVSTNSRKHKKSPPTPIPPDVEVNGNEKAPSDQPDIPLKPPRQLPHFRIEMFDKMKSLSSDRLRVNANHLKQPVNNPLGTIGSQTSKSESDTPCKVKDLVSIFQSDR